MSALSCSYSFESSPETLYCCTERFLRNFDPFSSHKLCVFIWLVFLWLQLNKNSMQQCLRMAFAYPFFRASVLSRAVAKASPSKMNHTQKSRGFKSGDEGGHNSFFQNEVKRPSHTYLVLCLPCKKAHRSVERWMAYPWSVSSFGHEQESKYRWCTSLHGL